MKKVLLSGLCLLFALFVSNVRATVIYWDPEATSTESAANLAGTWNTTSAQWSTTSAQTGSPTTWVSGDAACFCAGTTAVTGGFTVTLNSTLSCGGIYNGSEAPPGYNVTLANGGNGAISLVSGADAISVGGSDGDPLIMNVPMTGPGAAVLELSAQLYLNVPNTYSGGTYLGYAGVSGFYSIVNFTNGSFGAGPIYFYECLSGAMVVLGQNAVAVTNAVTNWQNVAGLNLNIVANAAGVTFSGPWNLCGGVGPSGTPSANTQLNLSSGGGVTNLINISGAISGTNGFNKYGVGMLELSGANTYGTAGHALGNTWISNGWFIAANTSGSATGVSSVIVTNSGAAGGGTLTGSGTISGSVTLYGGGISATNMGGGCATLTTGAETWNPGSSNIWAVNNVTGVAGTSSGWNETVVNGALKIGTGVVLDVTSLTAANKQGALASFDNTQNYTWAIATATGGITGAANLTINTSKFGNPLGAGEFTLSVSSNTLYLSFSQPPTVNLAPTNYTIGSDGKVYFNATATGAQLSYVWQLNGGALTADATGQGTARLTISPCADADAGSYTVTVSNAVSAVSGTSTLTVVNPPVFSGASGSGQFTMTYSGPVGHNYRIWSSTDPTLTPVVDTWNLAQFTTSFAPGTNTFTDTDADSTGEYYCITVP